MDRKILVIITLLICAIVAIFLYNTFGISVIINLVLVLLGISTVLFSRGILIFFTTLCLVVAQSPFQGLDLVAVQLRWVFFSLFALHVFGDIFLGRTVRNIKIFDAFAIIFVVYALLSSFYSPLPVLSRERAITILFLYISVFWIIWKYAYDQGPEKTVNLILKATMLIFIISYMIIFIGPYRAFAYGRFQGMFGHPNSIGITSAIFLPLSLWQYLETKKRTAKFFFFLILASLFLSASRNSINAAVISMGYFVYIRSRKYRPLIVFLSMALVFTLTWSAKTVAKKFFFDYYRTESIPTIGGRMQVWPLALDSIKDKPIMGYGFGVEEKIFALKYPMIRRQVGGYYMHNSYLGMMLQLGIVGFIIFYSPLFILLFKELSSRQDSKAPPLKYALRASVLAGLLCGIFESWLYSVGNAQVFPFWVMVMLLTFYRYQDKERITPDST